MSAGTLAIDVITKRFGGVVAVNAASLRVEPGQIHGLIGPNGAGKSTMISLISGFARPDSGSIRYGPTELVGLAPGRIVRLGISRTFQAATPLRGLSVIENVLVGLHRLGRAGIFGAMLATPATRREEDELRTSAHALLADVGLDDRADADPSDLPFGSLRFLEIARALAAKPSVLLFDEPAAGLNTAETERLRMSIVRVRERGISVILIDHDVPFVFSTCDVITVMNFGEVIASGTPTEVERDPAVRAAYLSSDPVEA